MKKTIIFARGVRQKKLMVLPLFAMMFVLMISIVNAQENLSIVDIQIYDVSAGTTGYSLHINSNIYAIFYEGIASDGWVKTFSMLDNGSFEIFPLASYEWDNSVGTTPEAIKIVDTIYAVVYAGLGLDGFIKTLNISDDGLTINEIDVLEHDITSGLNPKISKISNNVISVAYTSGIVGTISTFYISNDGIISAIDDYVFYSSAKNIDMINVTDNIYLLAYTDGSSLGRLQTLYIKTNGTINHSIDNKIFDISNGDFPSLVNIDSNTFVVSYEGNNSNGYIKTYDILLNGLISNTIDTYGYDAGVSNDGEYSDMILVISNKIALVYSDFDKLGQLVIIDIQNNGIIDGISEYITFESSKSQYQQIIYTNGYNYLIASDDLGGTNSIISINISLVIPIIDNRPTSNLISPANNLNYNTLTTQDIIFTSDATDDIELESMTFYWNITGSMIANGTQQLSGTSVQVYFNRTIIPNATIEWYVEVYDNNTQSDVSANWIVAINQTFPVIDTSNPVLSLISPQNNTINDTFPLPITFSVTDDSSNITCVLDNSTYIFDTKTFASGIQYLTLQYGNESELSQNFPNLAITCHDNSESNNSAVMNLNLTIDKVLPLMFIVLPKLNATFNKVYTGSTPIYTTCYDDNIYRLNVTISNSSDVIFSEQDMSPVGNTLVINSVLDISELGTGTYQKSDFCADSHTKNIIVNYNVQKSRINDTTKIKWITSSGNQIEIKHIDDGYNVKTYGSEKIDDSKYGFYYNINETESKTERTFIFELISDEEIVYLPNSAWKGHFITGNNWIDFEFDGNEDAEYYITKLNNGNYRIQITTAKTELNFSSVGELNTIEIISTITITFEPPREDEFVLGTCPVNTLPRAIMFIFFILLAFLIMGIGYSLKNGLIGFMGSILLIGMGVYTWFCLGFVSLIIMLLGIVMMSMFIFKGASAFK